MAAGQREVHSRGRMGGCTSSLYLSRRGKDERMHFSILPICISRRERLGGCTSPFSLASRGEDAWMHFSFVSSHEGEGWVDVLLHSIYLGGGRMRGCTFPFDLSRRGKAEWMYFSILSM